MRWGWRHRQPPIGGRKAVANQRGTTVWADQFSQTWAVEISTDSGQATIVGAIANYTPAGIIQQWEGDDEHNDVAATNAVYVDVNDACVLLFENAAGGKATVVVPAPVSACFLEDGETGDPSFLAALIGVAEVLICTPGGIGGFHFVNAQRSRSRRHGDGF